MPAWKSCNLKLIDVNACTIFCKMREDDCSCFYIYIFKYTISCKSCDFIIVVIYVDNA